MKHLYFVRHGQSERNAQGLLAGQIETPLTGVGRKQARMAGAAAKGLHIDAIVASPLSRAKQTAEIIAREIGFPAEKIMVNDLFLERNFGEMEGTPWTPTINVENARGVEPLDGLLARARKALDFLESLDADNVLVASHGSFGRALRQHVLQDFPFTHPHRLPNAEIVQWL